ncbi:MAG TPA: S8 family serine peptidase [Thermoanaerobaculia bacterium]|nr:S8 family serine peptidase [Thermoanaerobaculia bacterium]
MVTGVAAGNAATGKRDFNPGNVGYFLGTGIAPTAGILSTKIENSAGRQWLARTILDFAPDATSRSVYIQNHSHNEYNVTPSATGMYTLQSQLFDRAVRDSDGAGIQLSPITLTVSAGNLSQDSNQLLLLPPATSKNVIAVGGAEDVRDPSEWRFCAGVTHSDANSFRNIMADSKHGTLVQAGGHGWDTYAKPDLYAPASQIVSTRATDLSPQIPTGFDCIGYGGSAPDYDPDYFIDSGTSFAAPVAAGAALIASRVYAASLGGTPNPAAASPALLKAMLVASARSMRTALDKTIDPSVAITARPNAVQGFGRLSLVDIVSHSPARQYVDQSPSRTFTASGQKWSATYPVSDTSRPVKVVLVWTDAPAPAPSGNVPTLIQNDLDLLVSIGDSTNRKTYAGNNLIESTQSADEGEESQLYVVELLAIPIQRTTSKP